MALTVIDLMSAPAPPKADDFLIYPWLQASRVMLMVGPTDVGKTTLTLEWLAAMLRGGLLWDRFPTKQISRVLYLHAEHSLATVQEIAQKRGDIPPGLVSVIHDFGTYGTPLVQGPRPNIALLREITAVCDELKPNLIIAEPISAFLSESENDNKEARQLIQVLNNLGAKYGAAVLTHHHVGKGFFDPERIRPRGVPIGEARGAMAFEDASERVMYLRPEKDNLWLTTVKPKGYPVSPCAVVRDVETLRYHLVTPPEAQRDVLGAFGFRRAHSDMSTQEYLVRLRSSWGVSQSMCDSLVRRTVAVGLLTADLQLPEQWLPSMPSSPPRRTSEEDHVPTTAGATAKE